LVHSSARAAVFRLVLSGGITLLAVVSGCHRTEVPAESAVAKSSAAEPQHARSLAPQRKTNEDSPRARVRVATYNINWANAHLPAVLDTIRQADADLVCLQEVNSQSAAALRLQFGDAYSHLGFYGSVEPYLAGGFAVLSRLPVTREEFVPARHGLFGVCVLEITIDSQPVQVINVHLQPVIFHDDEGRITPLSVLTAFEAAEQTHRAEMNDILSLIRTDIPVLIMGDFNSCSTFQGPSMLVARGMVDSFAAVTEKPDTHPTWHWPTRFGEAVLRIDYIFHSPSFRTLNSRVLRSAGSDHYLVVSAIER